MKAYDTLRLYIETCAALPLSGMAFGDLGTAVDIMSSSYSRFLTYRDWLKSVLYLNKTTDYYCSDLDEIEHTFEKYWPYDYNAGVAFIDFIISTGRCGATFADLGATRAKLRRFQIMFYQDSVHDSLATPIDTTLPSLQSIGLGVLLSGVPEAYTPHLGQEIISFAATENPFRRENEISFELGEIDAAQIEIFDLLGSKVFSSERKVFVGGVHSIPVDISSAPSGTYYARLTTGHGDTQTLKLVKK